jgi:NADH-quinone oxidoreductase subunit E
MAVRRLHPEQPATFAFSSENEAYAKATIAKYPSGKQASAVIPLLMRAQEQHQGWLPEPAIRHVADLLGMAYIRVYEIATFYTQFQLSPVGRKAHVQVCGTTPCMLRGAEALKDVCRQRIHQDQFHLSADGNFSWEEVECAGACANAPMVQIFADTYEDLTPALLETVLDGYAAGRKPKPGSQIGRTASAPAGGTRVLTEPSLYDGSQVGAWRQRFEEAETAHMAAAALAAAVPPAGASTRPAVAAAPAVAPANPPAPNAAAPATTVTGVMAGAKPPAPTRPKEPPRLAGPRDGKPDDLKLIWGVAEKLETKLNAAGFWHYDQIAQWTPAECLWIETHIEGMHGRIERDRWLEQCVKLAGGWRPDATHGHGVRPRG